MKIMKKDKLLAGQEGTLEGEEDNRLSHEYSIIHSVLFLEFKGLTMTVNQFKWKGKVVPAGD